MKTETALKNYLAKRKNTIHSLLKVRSGKFTAQHFHKLRVEIKKLNALCALINYEAGYFSRKKTFKPLKHLFKQAGKVREIQLEADLLKKYSSPSSLQKYLKELRKTLIKERKIFFSITDKKIRSDIIKSFNKIESSIEDTDKKKTCSYIMKRKRKIEALIQKELKPNQLHKLRKRLKEYYYDIKSVRFRLQKEQLKPVEELQERLGQWHDDRVMSKHLQKVIDAREINTKEILRLEMIKSKLDTNSNQLFKKIIQATPALKLY